MNLILIVCLSLILSGGLLGCSTTDHRSGATVKSEQKAASPLSALHTGMIPASRDLYLHLFSSFIYPEPPRLIVSAPIHPSADFYIPMSTSQHLTGRVESRNGKWFVHFQVGLCSGANVFDGEV